MGSFSFITMLMRRLLITLSTAAFWLAWPVLYLVIGGTRRTRVLVIHDDKILVIKNLLADGRWSLPGGGIHKSEDPAVGAARELAEETGIHAEPATLISLGAQPCTNHGITYSAHYFAARMSSRPITRPDFEVLDLTWANPKQLTDNVSPDVRVAVSLDKALN